MWSKAASYTTRPVRQSCLANDGLSKGISRHGLFLETFLAYALRPLGGCDDPVLYVPNHAGDASCGVHRQHHYRRAARCPDPSVRPR